MDATPVLTSVIDPQPSAAGDSEGLARRHLWLAALHQLALADGQFAPEERQLLEEALAQELPGESLEALHHPGDGALQHRLGIGTAEAEQFLRSAVVVALADGRLGEAELTLLRHWSELLQVGQAVLADLHAEEAAGSDADSTLERLRGWLDAQAPSDPAVARLLVKLIPAQCPFERDVMVLGRRIVHIPPMCQINPLYEQLMSLRFRCLCLLAGEEPPSPMENPPSRGVAG
jgi:tellurite resistance protein